MRVVIANAFSLSMLPLSPTEVTLRVVEISEEQVRQLLLSSRFESAIGHEATATFLSKKLSIDIPANRVKVTLDKDTALIVMQLLQRLPEGKVLTEEEIAQIPVKFFLVLLLDEKYYKARREWH